MTNRNASLLATMQSAAQGLERGETWEVARSLLLARPEGVPPRDFYQIIGLALFKDQKFELAKHFLLREASLYPTNNATIDLLWVLFEQCHLSSKREFVSDLLASLIRDKSLVIEVGSTYGRVVKKFLAAGHSVVSIEPRKEWCDFQRIAFANEIKEQRLIIQEYGCSNIAGERSLFLSTDVDKIFSSIQPDWRASFPASFTTEAIENVEVRKLSDLILSLSEHPEAVILDCEGEELRIMGDMIQFVPEEMLPKVLAVVFHPPFSTPDVIIEAGRLALIHGYSKIRFVTDWWQVTTDEGQWLTSVKNVDTCMWSGIYALCKWQTPSPTLIFHKEDR